MKTDADKTAEVRRLEALWAGTFGDEYSERNQNAHEGRGVFWKGLLLEIRPKNVLEVGCNVGGNLKWIAEILPPNQVWGIDINETAIQKTRGALRGVNAVWSPARDLPFRADYFDLVFTAGVLIHQPEDSLAEVMAEVVRCAKKYVLCLEYYSKETAEVPYRGNRGALFKRDYGKIYADAFPELRLLKRGNLKKSDGWDDVTVWLLEKGKRKGLKGKRKK